MISNEDVKRLFSMAHGLLSKDHNEPVMSQFYRGGLPDDWEGQVTGACSRHMAVFKHFSIIPKYCFSCYKVIIEPRTVIELFKLMMVFEKTVFPNDNTRKCLVEGRPEVSGTYKGMIYCRSIIEGEQLIKMLQPILSEEIDAGIPIGLKRGCSEYSITYPAYGQVGQGESPMSYKSEWQAKEDFADARIELNKKADALSTHNRPDYDVDDYRVMLTWLKYAATIGDNSYLKISEARLPSFQGLIRPAPFVSAED